MNTFKKEERLCSKKLIEELFHNGSSFLLYPLRIVWLKNSLPIKIPAQVVINVSKRRFKRAVDRNLIKRRIRESYRLNKSENLYHFLNENSTQLLLGIHYIGKEIATFKVIDKKLKLVLVKLRQNCLTDHS